MYDGNPGEIDFGSSYREVRVSQGSSYRESTVCTVQYDATTFLTTSFSISGDGSVWTWGWGKISYT